MIDSPQAMPRTNIRMVYGRLDEKSQLAVDRALTLFLGIAR